MNSINKERKLTSNQKFMVFILYMVIFGLSDLVTQIIPEFAIGPVEIRVPYFAFIAVSLAIIFDPISVALGSAFGSVIFGGLLMGNFGGVGEIEGFLQLSLAIFLGGIIVSNPKNKKQVFLAACVTVGVDKFIGGLVDIAKVFIGLAELEPVKGLPESLLIIQGFEFLNDFILAGILFGAIPAIYLVPKIYGKIEPLLGIKPREGKVDIEWNKILNLKFIFIAIVSSLISAGAAFLDELDFNLINFELEFENLLGGNYIYLARGISVIILLIIIKIFTNKTNKDLSKSI